jgi:hypothetical protein
MPDAPMLCKQFALITAALFAERPPASVDDELAHS